MAMDRHPIQLVSLDVEELYLRVLDRYKFTDKEYSQEFSLSVGRSDYDAERKEIFVKLTLEFIPEVGQELDRPYEMRVQVAGQFQVDDQLFPIEQINNWAQYNAPMILIPYIREHSYSLSIRAGFEGLIVPMITVPTLKIQK
jgi:preprotein translocase subunit SecB